MFRISPVHATVRIPLYRACRPRIRRLATTPDRRLRSLVADVLSAASYQWSPYAAPPLVACVAAAALAVGVLVREGVSRVSLAMAAMALSAGIWQLGFAFVYSASTPDLALVWMRVAYLGVPFIPSSAYVFAVGVLRLRGRGAMVALSI